MKPVAITLLIPCYNAAKYLARLMESVAAMSQPFSAILCYDDGSADDTVAVARRLGLEIITGNPNSGVAHARNQLASAASTEWIHFHDADDWIAPTFVERLSPWCDSRHDVVSCDADWVSEGDGEVLIKWRYDPAALSDSPHRHLLSRPLGLNSSVICRGAWHEVGGCDESLAMWEDADVHIRLARNGARFHHVPEVLTRSLRRADSFSHDYRKSWNCRLQALHNYATHPAAENVRETLASEAELAASQLAALNDRDGASRAVALCRRFGGNPPTSRNPVMRILKPFLPAEVLLRWQVRHRNRKPILSG